jgi:hypothetical protein
VVGLEELEPTVVAVLLEQVAKQLPLMVKQSLGFQETLQEFMGRWHNEKDTRTFA